MLGRAKTEEILRRAVRDLSGYVSLELLAVEQPSKVSANVRKLGKMYKFREWLLAFQVVVGLQHPCQMSIERISL